MKHTLDEQHLIHHLASISMRLATADGRDQPRAGSHGGGSGGAASDVSAHAADHAAALNQSIIRRARETHFVSLSCCC